MKIKFLPQDVEFEVKPGESVLHVAQDHNVHIKSVCRGLPSCAECRVRVVDGEHNVLPPSAAELSLIGSAWFVDRRRLSCQLRCFGDVTIDMTEQIEKTESSTKKPRGRYNKDELQESRAVLGSLVMSDDEEDSSSGAMKESGAGASQRARSSGRPLATESAPMNDRDREDEHEFDGADGDEKLAADGDDDAEAGRDSDEGQRDPQRSPPSQQRSASGQQQQSGNRNQFGGRPQQQGQGNQQNAGSGGTGEGGPRRRRRNRRGKRRGGNGQGGGGSQGGGHPGGKQSN